MADNNTEIDLDKRIADDNFEDVDVDVDDDVEETDAEKVTVVKRRSPAGRSAASAKRPETRSAAAAPTGRGSGGWGVAAGILAVLCALLIAATGFLGFQYFSGRADSPANRAEVVKIANDYAIKLSSFDYRDLNKNRAAIEGMSTEDFGKKYGEMVKALTEIVSNGKGVATAEVINSAAESVTKDKATVILFVNQKARNVVAPDGKNQPYRMVVKLVRNDGRWLVDDVQTV